MSHSQIKAALRSAAPVVLPSMLMCDFANLEREVQQLEAAGAKAFHLDVMDGVFVPNLTYGMPIVAAMRRLTDRPLDVHLMIARPQDYVKAFVEAGADVISFHAEAVDDASAVLREIRSYDRLAGIVINPDTPVSRIAPVLGDCDLVLIMSVQAGFGGQAFQPVALEKMRTVRELGGDELLIEVDGGINTETIAACGDAGAQLFVVGSGIFKASDYREALASLTALAQ